RRRPGRDPHQRRRRRRDRLRLAGDRQPDDPGHPAARLRRAAGLHPRHRPRDLRDEPPHRHRLFAARSAHPQRLKGTDVQKSTLLALLRSDRVALVAAVWLVLIAGVALVGPEIVGKAATSIDLRARNAPPFDFSRDWVHWLGSDSLGRGILARIFLAARTTLGIALASVLVSMIVGGVLGIVAG